MYQTTGAIQYIISFLYSWVLVNSFMRRLSDQGRSV